MSKQISKAIQATSVLYAGTISITSFWIFFILAESYDWFHNFFGFYKPTGGILGTFLASLVIFVGVGYGLLNYFKNNPSTHKKVQDYAIITYMVSSILFLFMVFPPVIAPIIDWIS